MLDTFMKLGAALMYWKLALFRVSGKAIMAIAISLAQALNGIEWSSFTPTQKFICIVLAIGTGWSIVDAFLDQTLSTIQKDPDGLGIPGAESRTTQQTVTVKTEVAATPGAGVGLPP